MRLSEVRYCERSAGREDGLGDGDSVAGPGFSSSRSILRRMKAFLVRHQHQLAKRLVREFNAQPHKFIIA